MDTIPEITIASLIDRYDVLLLDAYGVLVNSSDALPGGRGADAQAQRVGEALLHPDQRRLEAADDGRSAIPGVRADDRSRPHHHVGPPPQGPFRRAATRRGSLRRAWSWGQSPLRRGCGRTDRVAFRRVRRTGDRRRVRFPLSRDRGRHAQRALSRARPPAKSPPAAGES